MSFKEDKKRRIILYLLEKIDSDQKDIVKKTTENFGVSSNTIYRYIKELLDHKMIEKVKRGQYKLHQNSQDIYLSRSKNQLNSEEIIYDLYVKELLKDYPQNVRDIWNHAFSEMMNNVIDHSEAPDVILRIGITPLSTSIIICDNGIGIFKKIKEYFKFESLDMAVNELFKGKLTTDSENHSGEGIFFTSRMMDDFIIISDGKIFCHDKYDLNKIADLKDTGLGKDELFRTGTCVYMSLSNYSYKTTKEVFDEYSNIEGGFTKTRIPMKHMFDDSPVSRSQAKRVCNRLNRFKEVELDFKDIEWMGQGFAHQLFVVFPRKHPEVKLNPVNMNEDVQKMLNHVLDS